MMTQPVPSYDEWADYSFTRGYADFASVDDTDDERIERFERFVNIASPVLAGYIVRLFQSPEFLANRYTDNQIGNAVHFLFGTASEYFHKVRESSVEPALQVECYQSVETLYLRLFDRVCCNRGRNPDDRCENGVDGAVFMIWDMDCIEGAAMFEQEGNFLTEPCLDVLEAVLHCSRTSTCQASALHGLGHLYSHFEGVGKDPTNPPARRVRRAIDTFLNRQDMPDWLREYALQARDGAVK